MRSLRLGLVFAGVALLAAVPAPAAAVSAVTSEQIQRTSLPSVTAESVSATAFLLDHVVACAPIAVLAAPERCEAGSTPTTVAPAFTAGPFTGAIDVYGFTLGSIHRNRKPIPIGAIAEFDEEEGARLIARGIIRPAEPHEIARATAEDVAPADAVVRDTPTPKKGRSS